MQDLNTFKTLVRECLTRAGEKYGLEEQMANVAIRLDIKGYRCAGQAVRRGFQFSVRFHPDAVMKHWDEMVNNTIPHEVAHTVCQMRPELGKNHDAGWKRVCRSLGGDDARTHTLEFGTKPQRPAYWYKTTTGYMIDVGPQRHAKLQRGHGYRVRGNGALRRDGYVGNTKPTQSQPGYAMAARTQAPKQVDKPVTGQSGSKAEQARTYIQTLLDSGTRPEVLLKHASSHAKHLHKELGFGTYSAARSCFVANTKKLAK
jgi:predicted SprT family Zn-dependent metalloprotease